MVVRKIVTLVEEIHLEGGRPVAPAARIAVVAAVVRNPWAGQGFVDDLGPGIDANASDLGELLAPQVLDALGAPAEAFGKAAIVGLDGEIEHGSAIIHNLRFGNRVRDPVDGTSLLPAAEKRGAAGAPIDIAIKHKHDHSVRSHHQTFEVRIADAPRADEIVIWVALAASGRPLSRLGEFGSELATAP